MRARDLAAVAAGVVGAATSHALDAAGLLPGVHETEAVRTAMGPVVTVFWLGLAGGLAWVATRTRPALVGGSSALVVSAIPELVGRHDPGAIGEPGAVAGALMQWLLLMAVVAVLVVVDRSLAALVVPSSYRVFFCQQAAVGASHGPRRIVDRRGRPRAPPAVLSLLANVS
jgi:hypothetical protein